MKHNFHPFDRVLVRDRDDEKWQTGFFSHEEYNAFYVVSNAHWLQCIPYEGNEHLLGTTDSPEPEFKRGDLVLVWNDDIGRVRKGIRVYSHYDKELNKHMTYSALLKDGVTTEAYDWNYAEKFVPASVEDSEARS